MRHRILSFKYASSGIYQAFKEEPNLKFHFLAAFLVIFAGIYFHLKTQEWIDIILLIGLVLTSELTNTAIETVVDSFTLEEHPGAKKAKDVSAGATFIVSITASIVGLIIFVPYVLALLNG